MTRHRAAAPAPGKIPPFHPPSHFQEPLVSVAETHCRVHCQSCPRMMCRPSNRSGWSCPRKNHQDDRTCPSDRGKKFKMDPLNRARFELHSSVQHSRRVNPGGSEGWRVGELSLALMGAALG